MQQENRLSSDRRNSGVFFTVILIALLNTTVTGTLIAQAPAQKSSTQGQNVEVHDAGGGNKTELIRNAAGEVVENRTIDSTGRVRSVVKTDYPPGHYVPNQMTTSYYPDSKGIESTAVVKYDPNANFISEVTEQFDQSGKHISGHKLLHDPINGEFRCWKWNASSTKYDRVVCPSGEESGEKPPPLRRINQDEAVKLFDAARVAAAAEQKSRRMTTKNPVAPPVTPQEGRFNVVLPAVLIPGKQVSGSILENANFLRLRPDLIVREVKLPLAPGSEAAKLSGWQIEVGGAPAQRADSPFTFVVPPGASQIEVKLYPEGEPGKAVMQSVSIAKSAAQAGKSPSGYVAQVLCVAADVCPIAGVFSGNATNSTASFGNRPATIAAETNDMVFVRVPEDLLMEQQLLFNEGNELLAFPVVIAQLDVVVDGAHLDPFQHEIAQGEKKLVFAGTVGVQNLPEEDWRAGMFPKSNLVWARRFVPGFEVPRETHAQREEREMMEKMEQQEKGTKISGKQNEEKLGNVVLFLKNATPDFVSWRGSKDQAFVLPLNTESFSQGDFRYKFVVEASKTGTYAMDVALIPFVAPIQGQKFTLSSSSAAQ
jgi:hypothetical protein